MTPEEINHSLQLYVTLLSIASVIIMLLLSAIGYFLKQLASSFKELQSAMQIFREEYIDTKSNVNSMNMKCRDRNEVVDKRLNAHADRLDEHEKKLTRIETKMEN